MIRKTPIHELTEKNNPNEMPERPKILVSIVERGKGKELMNLYNKENVTFHYQTIGHGTATSEIMDILGLDSKDKDIIISFSGENAVNQLIYKMSDELRGFVDTKGILFDIPLTGMSNMIAAALSIRLSVQKDKKGTAPTILEKTFLTENKPDSSAGKEVSDMSSEKKQSLILVSVNQGYTENVLDTARSLGARGGTIIRARWSGEKSLEKHHGIALQAEKEIIAIVVSGELRNKIMDAVNEKYGLKTEAQGVVCNMNVDHFAPI